MPFPIEPDARTDETESDFLIQDPFGLRRAITPVFVRDLHDGMFEGCGTSFYVTPFGHQLSAMHITTDFFNDRGISIRSGPTKTLIQPDDGWIGILHDPGLVFGSCPAGDVLYATDFVLFPVDQHKHPNAITFTDDRLKYVEPELDLASWNIAGLGERKTTFLPIRVGGPPSVKVGDRLMAVGYPNIKSWHRPGAQIVTYQEEMRAAVGTVIEVSHEWDHDRKIWPTIVVEGRWRAGMSGGPVFNEDGEVVGIVSRGIDQQEDGPAWSRALWLEALPYRSDIYGSVDPRNPGWICGWGVCNSPTSLVGFFETKEAAEAFASKQGSRLQVRQVSTPHPSKFARPERTRRQ
jgi:serine protease Do